MYTILFTDSLGAGGAQRQLVGLAVLLKEQGYDVKVCTYYSFDFYRQYLEDNGVSNEIIPSAANRRKRIFAVRKYFKREKPDWVIAYQETPSLVSCIAKILGCDFKLLVSERNTTQTLCFSNRLRFQLYHFVEAIVPNSYSQERFLINRYSWMKDKIHVVTNFVDLEKFHFVNHKKRKIPEIIIPASLMPSKNALGFIKACAILKEKGVKFHVKWFGISLNCLEYHSKCIELINKYSLQNDVCLLEKTKEIDKKYQEADFLCLPSFFEGTPNVICEALSTGLPIMCSNVCDNSFYVQEDVNGVLFNPKNPQDIAEKIEIMMSISDEKYEQYRIASRKIAERKLCKQEFLNKYLNIIQEQHDDKK